MKPPAAKARAKSGAAVIMNARLRLTGGKGFDVIVTELTAAGCSISRVSVELRLNQPVSIKLDTLDYVKGSISWASDATAGIEFERPLYAPVVEPLQRLHG